MANELDPLLLQRFVHGDRAAFEALFRAFERDVYRWIVRIVRDRSTAEDGVVEAFWRCYRSRARFDPSRGFGPWMRRIATHVAIDLLKATPRRSSVSIDVIAATPVEADGSRGPGAQPWTIAIAQAFELLSPKLRAVATLALIEECPHAEIAEALGVPIGTVKSRLFRATQRLKQQLARLYEENR
jgi:RNA polymerase sigma-70 factor (ECF subfamily)